MTDTRTRIIDAANRLFVARGASNVLLSEIAAEAGVGRATVYRHFGDREGLVEAAVDRFREDVADRLRTAVEARADFVGQVAAVGRQFAEIAVETRLDVRQSSLHDHHLAEVFVGSMDRIVGDLTDFIEPLVNGALDRDELRLDIGARVYADWLSRMLVAVLVVPASTTVDMRSPSAVEDYIRDLVLAARKP